MSESERTESVTFESSNDAVMEALRAFHSAVSEWQRDWPQSIPASNGKTAWAGAMGNASIDPQRVMQAQWQLLQSQQQLWMDTTARLLGLGSEPEEVIEPPSGDRRFKDAEWDDNPFYSYLKQTYLLNARWMEEMLDSLQGLDPDLRRSVEFYSRQIIDAMAPTNFALTNPTVLKTAQETKGQSLVDGLDNLIGDLARSQGSLSITQSDPDAFQVGVNIAITPGQVVYQNDLMQLIQYAPATQTVYARPLLFVPPWINKYYILDLKPENSLIKWCTEQGYTVFVVSWVNPDERYRDKGFDDYVRDGVLAAVDAVEQATGSPEMSAVGYCIGGTLLGISLAYMAAKGDERITSATFFAAQVDFEEAGCLRVFTGDKLVEMLEPELEKKGYLDGEQMASAFNMLRANDLIWYFVINNYLLGKAPRAFELLHWNADSTRFPARLLIEYLRGMYQHNLLATPGAFEVLGEPIDLGQVTIPTFIQATAEDHISPGPSVFKSMQRFSGSKRFVLAGSGHIAGVINPPASQRYQHWTNTARKTYDTFDGWLADASETPGSWWPAWHAWLSRRSGRKIAARTPGDGALPAIEPAPGSYVRVRSRD